MAFRRKRTGNATTATAIAASLLLSAVFLASCGPRSEDSARGSGTTSKLPPGMTEEEGAVTSAGASGFGEEESASSPGGTGTSAAQENTSSSTTSFSKTVTLSGVEFTVSGARRQGNNKLVASSGARQVDGDFLEVELGMKNVGDSLADLSRFSFRLWNPHIDAASYDDYYGEMTTYGGYVSANIISAALLDYATLQKVSVTLRIGEELGDVFLFFDLNPLSVSRNEGFTKEGSNLIIYDTWTGEKVEVNLAGFPD